MSLTVSWTTSASNEDAESQGLFAGYEGSGEKVYVGRVLDSDGNLLPAKVIPSHNKSYYACGDSEMSSDKMEVLSNADGYEWIHSSDGTEVSNAVTLSGFYVGRAIWNGNTVVGRIDLKSKQFVGCYDNETFTLPEYDVLVFNPVENVIVASVTKDAEMSVRPTSEYVMKEVHNEEYEKKEIPNIGTKVTEKTFTFQNVESDTKYLDMMNKIRTLEAQLSLYKSDHESYEQRILREQKRVEELTMQIQTLKTESSTVNKQRFQYEENLGNKAKKYNDLEIKYNNLIAENVYMLAKIKNIEAMADHEKYQTKMWMEKYQNYESYTNTLTTKLRENEERVKNDQNKILALESKIENTSSGGETMMRKVASYENTVKQFKQQIDGYLKKLQSSSDDNQFLISKIAILTKNLQNYKNFAESMDARLQKSKTIIASTNAELSRATAKVAQYQSALATCYILNGNLMTKVSSMSQVSQFETGFDSSLDILNLNDMQSSKNVDFKSTSYLLEVTNSESYINYIKKAQEDVIEKQFNIE